MSYAAVIASAQKKEDQLHETEARWFAVRTKAKSEKYVQVLLQKKHIVAYVPLQRLMKRYKKCTKMHEKPLINSYIFVKIIKPEYLRVIETENVAGFIKFDRAMIAIPENEIELMRRFTLETELEMEAIPGVMPDVGDHVEIKAGNLMGLKGRVMEFKGKRRLLVELETVGYSLLITIDAHFLNKVGRF